MLVSVVSLSGLKSGDPASELFKDFSPFSSSNFSSIGSSPSSFALVGLLEVESY